MAKVREACRLASPMRIVAVAITCALVLATTATAAVAAGTPNPCSPRNQGKVFQDWGDDNNYFAMPNGGFEEGSDDWWLYGNARVVWGNEPFDVGGWADMRSLRLSGWAMAESRTICVGVGEDSVRLFVKNPRVDGASLHIDATVRNPATGRIATTGFDIDADAAPYGWAPTVPLRIPNLLGSDGGQQELTLRFTTGGTPATWYIDDVYVDPWKLR